MILMTKSIPQWIDRRVQLGAVALFGCLLASCTDGADPSTPVANGRARIPLVAYYAGAHAPSTAPINRIRITVTTDPGGREFGPFVVEVDPAAAEWTVPVEIPLATPTDVIVVAELINFANNTETVEFSGRMGPFRVTPGPAASTPPTSLQVFPGPLANLNVTAVRVSGAAPVIEGGSIQLIATLEGAGPGAQVFWTSLD